MKEYRRVRHAANTAVLTVRGCSDLLGDAAADGPGGLDAGGARLGQACLLYTSWGGRGTVKIKRMTASFGGLEGARLELRCV